tara:strand:- start:2724 stop:3281 length:558 start_codon:yes stop_codon:yes gene_type:complete
MTQAIEAFERKPQKITALRVTAERAVNPGEWLVVNGDRQEIYSEAEFAEEFTPARSAPREVSHRRTRARRAPSGSFAKAMRAFTGAIKAVAADQKPNPADFKRRFDESMKNGTKMRPYAAGVTIAKLVDSGMVDDVLIGQDRTAKINYGCNVAKALLDRGILTRKRIETLDTANRKSLQFHYSAA